MILYELIYKKFPWGSKILIDSYDQKAQVLIQIEEKFSKESSFSSIFPKSDDKVIKEIKEILLSMLKYKDNERISFEELAKNAMFQPGSPGFNSYKSSSVMPSVNNNKVYIEEIKTQESYTFTKPTSMKNDVFNKESIDKTLQMVPEYFSMRHRKDINRFSEDDIHQPLPTNDIEDLIYSLNLRYIPMKYIKVGSLIKTGGFSQVYQAMINTVDYAVKQIINITPHLREKVLREASNYKNYENPRLIKMYGVSYNLNSNDTFDLYLIFELKERDLQIAINTGLLKEFRNKCKVALQIATGLYHLHKHVIPLVHSDLKPSNILLDDCLKVFITDLGISKEIKGLNITCSQAFTLGYAAPEQMIAQISGFKINTKTDIWSLGLLYFYLFFEVHIDYHFIINRGLCEPGALLKIEEELLVGNEKCRSIKNLIEMMVVYESSKRIGIEDVVEILRKIEQDCKSPLKI